MDIWSCEYYKRCKNNTKCVTCGPEQRLLKLPEDKKRSSHQAKVIRNTFTEMSDNSGGTLEEYVAANFNNTPTVKAWEARRQAGSGNIWFMPGDVQDSVILAECKERSTVNSKGEKTMTIPKAMLEKIEEEAKTYNTYPALMFRYKGDERRKTYVTQDFDVLVEMVHEIKMLRAKEQVLQNDVEIYKKAAEELHKEVQRLKAKVGE